MDPKDKEKRPDQRLLNVLSPAGGQYRLLTRSAIQSDL